MPIAEPLQPPAPTSAPTPRVSNPFATRFVRPGAVSFEFPRSTAQPILIQRIVRLRISAIVGPHGNGKSTLLQALLPSLQTRFRSIQHWQLHASERSPWARLGPWTRFGPWALLAQAARCRADCLLVIDGFEQLPAPWRVAIALWMRLRRGRLLVTSHAPLMAIPTLLRARITHATARRLTRRLLADHQDYQPVMLESFERHWKQHQPNLRDVWFAMYDDFEAALSAG